MGTNQGPFLRSLVKIQWVVSEEKLFKEIVDARTHRRKMFDGQWAITKAHLEHWHEGCHDIIMLVFLPRLKKCFCFCNPSDPKFLTPTATAILRTQTKQFLCTSTITPFHHLVWHPFPPPQYSTHMFLLRSQKVSSSDSQGLLGWAYFSLSNWS